MNVAVIFAGGIGSRMKLDTVPKQFLIHSEKPILVYTLEHFQFHDEIDGIIVVIATGYESATPSPLRCPIV